ncbi:hypothetical protein V4C53_35130, partial [Paraburkholderia azotifigens]|uniref:hypothetical protein n=1 Tax=Paraburkholderia azotifigens TaxID=2057004 RepID=UPI00316C238C
IDSDAHSVDQLDNLRYGVNQARRGWLEKADVLNARSLARLRPCLRGRCAHVLAKLPRVHRVPRQQFCHAYPADMSDVAATLRGKTTMSA